MQTRPTIGIWVAPEQVKALPVSGPAWLSLKAAADTPLGAPDVSDQDDRTDVLVMARALVYARTGAARYRDEVIGACDAAIGTEAGGRTLALGRNLIGYVLAADLVGLPDDVDRRFCAWLSTCLDEPLAGRTLRSTHEERPNNWGTHAGASRMAVARYLRDDAELARAAEVFKGWLGDRAAYAGFEYGDLSWQADPDSPVGINRKGATKAGHDVDGVLPDDQRRGGAFTWPPPKEKYVYEALQGAIAQAVILQRAGRDPFSWQDQALRRAYQWLHSVCRYEAAGDDTWQPHVINHFYGTSFPAPVPARPGKNVGWADWTHAGTASGSPPAPAAAPAAAPPAADLVIENARIWSDGLAGFAEFAAVRGGRFVHVGAPDARHMGPATRRVDAGGRVVVPGLIDSHIHMLSGGLQMSRLQLRDATGRRDFIERVAAWAATLGPGDWILGGRWSTESWDDPAAPTKAWVDGPSGGRPLFLSRMDGHSALVNSEAMRRAGITAQGPADPPGGVIDRDPESGEPTGILRESAMDLVARLIPEPTLEDRVAALERAIDHALRHGITAVGDIPDIDDLPVYERLAAARPRLRFFLYPTAGDWPAAVERARGFRGSPGRVELRGFKAYMDGSLGSRTAYMSAPYEDSEERRGLLRPGVEDGQLAQNLSAASEAGLQAIVHAIGDQANHVLLDMLEEAWPRLAAARCRSEHAQHLLPQDIQRFAALGVIASMQPVHKADDGRYAEASIGPQRSRTSYAFRSLLDAGAVVCFGSDWPVVTLNPLAGIEAAVTGRILGGGTWQTQECITVGEALRCYTSRAAWAVFAENDLGRIGPGLLADFVILDGSPFGADPPWQEIRPVEVFVGGQPVLRR